VSDIPTFPIAGYEIGTVLTGSVIMRLPFYANALQTLEEADPGRTYHLSVEQAEQIRDALDRAIQKVKNRPSVTPGPAN
jgi:hypothetical protein